MITIRFVSHPGIFNWGTRVFQSGFWADHVDAVLPDGRMLGAHFKGVQILPADYDAGPGQLARELRVDLKTTAEREERFFAFLMAQVGKPYDFKALVAFAFARDWRRQDSWICSELQAAALEACGIFPNPMPIEVNKVTLRDLCMAVGVSSKDDFRGESSWGRLL